MKDEIKLLRPEPIIAEMDVVPFNQRMSTLFAVESLLEGNYVLVLDYFSSGLSVLAELKKNLESQHRNQSFRVQRDFRAAYHEISQRLLLEIRAHKLAVKKAPEIGWFKLLYPDSPDFLLPFPQVQGLNSSWQWYEKGLAIPGLNKMIHPYFGTYFPTRFEHLKLFDEWLKQYRGKKESAFDIGIGCGVLSFMMLKHGFTKVIGTDSNPNAIIGLQEEFQKQESNSQVELFYGDLFANINTRAELIVFNPPWLPASYDSEGIDKAIYYDKDLFPRFFSEATKHLTEDGRVIILFSNLGEITNAATFHPVQRELAKGGRFMKESFRQRKADPASKNTKRTQNWRDDEMVELWVLKKK